MLRPQASAARLGACVADSAKVLAQKKKDDMTRMEEVIVSLRKELQKAKTVEDQRILIETIFSIDVPDVS